MVSGRCSLKPIHWNITHHLYFGLYVPPIYGMRMVDPIALPTSDGSCKTDRSLLMRSICSAPVIWMLEDILPGHWSGCRTGVIQPGVFSHFPCGWYILAQVQRAVPIESRCSIAHMFTGWWLGTFFFHNLWDSPSHCPIFFKMIQTTNQIYIYFNR